MIEIIPNWHPIFVHFTVALFSIATALHLVSPLVQNRELKAQWRIVARWNLWLGMAISVVTVLTGWYAYNTVEHDALSHQAMTEHRNWALATVTLFFIATAWSIIRYRSGKEASALLLILLALAMTSLGSTAWRGGEIVYRYGLGVMSLPNAGSHGHKEDIAVHDHNNADSTDDHHDKEATMPADNSTQRTRETAVKSKVAPHDHHEDSAPHTH